MRTKNLLFFRLFFCLSLSFVGLKAQTTELNTAVDSTQVKIGEAIQLSLQVKTAVDRMVEFPPEPNFSPLELLEEYPIDTLSTPPYHLLTKRYALILFDSGRYTLPRQKVMVDGRAFFSDSIAVQVATVAVDTLKQPLFDIKPIQKATRDYSTLYKQLIWIVVVLILCVALYFLVRQFQKKRAALLEEIPPFERAIHALKILEEQLPNAQADYKKYYSELTEVVRRYLEEEAAIDALESTTDELLDKLNLRKDAGTLDLSMEILNNLRKVLQQADLVKFARSAPALDVVSQDRQMVEQVVIETQEALPEPSQEEREASAAYQLEQKRKRRKQKIQLAGLGALTVVILAILGTITYYGFTPVKDTVFRYPTKVLLDGTWIKSIYGTPPMVVETPQVLLRDPSSNKQKLIYAAGNPTEGFYSQLFFEKRNPEKKETTEEEKEAATRQLLDEAIARYEAEGATNILVQNDTFSTQQGMEALRLFGSLEIGTNENAKRCRFVSILLPFEQATVELKMIYPKDDRYGPAIEQRILTSLNVLKDL